MCYNELLLLYTYTHRERKCVCVYVRFKIIEYPFNYSVWIWFLQVKISKIIIICYYNFFRVSHNLQAIQNSFLLKKVKFH